MNLTGLTRVCTYTEKDCESLGPQYCGRDNEAAGFCSVNEVLKKALVILRISVVSGTF